MKGGKMGKMWIRWTIPTNTEYYAPDDYEGIEEDVRNYTANEEKLIRKYVEKHYPDAELTIDLVPEIMSVNNRSWVRTADGCFAMSGEYGVGKAKDILDELDYLVERFMNSDGSHSPDFDAERFISPFGGRTEEELRELGENIKEKIEILKQQLKKANKEIPVKIMECIDRTKMEFRKLDEPDMTTEYEHKLDELKSKLQNPETEG